MHVEQQALAMVGTMNKLHAQLYIGIIGGSQLQILVAHNLTIEVKWCPKNLVFGEITLVLEDGRMDTRRADIRDDTVGIGHKIVVLVGGFGIL